MIGSMLYFFGIYYILFRPKWSNRFKKIIFIGIFLPILIISSAMFSISFVLADSGFDKSLDMGFFVDNTIHDATFSIVKLRNSFGFGHTLFERGLIVPMIDLSIFIVDLFRLPMDFIVVLGNELGRNTPESFRYTIGQGLSYLSILIVLSGFGYIIFLFKPEIKTTYDRIKQWKR